MKLVFLFLVLACAGRKGEPAPTTEPVGEATPAAQPAPAVKLEPAPPAEPAPEGVPGCEDTETRRYVGDLDTCSRIRYTCGEGEDYFNDGCGCGCEKSSD